MDNPLTVSRSSQEKRALLARLLRERSKDARRDVSVNRLFEEQVARTPSAVAVQYDGQSLSYRQLSERANRLAHRLQALGVGAEDLVGLCTDRSPDMIVGLLGILKAGGAYLPLDPSYPKERLAFMLENSRAQIVVTQREVRRQSPARGVDLLYVDVDSDELKRENTANVACRTASTNLAYVIYTSGSTGRPKGVQVTRGALTNFLLAMRSALGVTTKDGLLAVTTLSFDIAGLELFLPLVCGACVHLATRDQTVDGRQLIGLLDDPRITFLQATPATWRLLLDAGWKGNPSITMLCGGEALPWDLASQLANRGKALWNLYGPTETTIWSTAGRIDAADGSVSIGRPIANTQIHVLDGRLRPVPAGVAGDLYIGGAGLARGYRGRPALTAERFVPDHRSGTLGARLYRTGDRARWRADGTLDCLGRVDGQVKVRGFRIELGEVESVLASHPSVRQVIVTADDDGSGIKTLSAHIVPDGSPEPAVADIRAWLRAKLPEYMVPTAYFVRDAMPLTPNGKIDRKALSNSLSRPSLASAAGAPRTPIEEGVAAIWKDVLGLDRVARHDHFFELGGHSLLAARIQSRLRDTFDTEIPLRELFESLTVAGQAQLVENALQVHSTNPIPPIQRIPRDGPLPSSYAQPGLWYIDQLEPGSAAYHIATAVRLTGPLNIEAFERAVNEVVQRHEALRTTFIAPAGVPLQVIAPSHEFTAAVADLSALPSAEREAAARRWIDEEARRTFDLKKGPLFRVKLLQLGPEEHVVAATMHHIISDGWSIGILVRELGECYGALVEERPIQLPEMRVQYADFAAWQRQWPDAEVMAEELRYWTTRLAGVPNLELPTDRPRRASLVRRGRERRRLIPLALVSELRTLSRHEGATLFMTLVASFQALLSRYSGQQEFAVGTPIAGRTRPEVEGLIGLFVNTLVMRADFTGVPSFRELLKRVRCDALGAYAHQDVPFEHIVTALHAERSTSRSPVFQAMFAMQNAPMPALETAGLTMTPLELELGAAKVDVTLFATEVEHGLNVALEYDADMFEAETIDRMLANLHTLFEEIVAHPDVPVAMLQIATEAEQQTVIEQWTASELMDDEDSSDAAASEGLKVLPIDSSTDNDVHDE
jgi:amino acid adenylation domain-containing protein